MIRFTLDIVPPTATAQQKGACVRGGRVHFFEKANVRSARETLMAAVRPFVPSQPIGKPVQLTVEWVFPYRKSEKKATVRAGNEISHTSRPDLDNLEKQLLDVLTILRFWTDDSLVYDKYTRKVWGPSPCINVRIIPDGE